MNHKISRTNYLSIFKKDIINFYPLIKSRIKSLEEADFIKRFCQKDVSLWSSKVIDQDEIAHRLDWIDAPANSQTIINEAEKLLKELVEEGYTHAVVLGMGGSSLAPEVFSSVIKNENIKDNFLDVLILDSTDPEQIETLRNRLDLEKTIFIVSSKSGTTAEVNALFSYFWNETKKSGILVPGKHFIAISDPSTPLIELGIKNKFRKVIWANPDVGGRFSALIEFGLIPAILSGYNGHQLLENAATQMIDCNNNGVIEKNMGVVLGIVLAEAYLSGKDKLTILSESKYSSIGSWIEQLIAESSGKSGKGMLPVHNEPLLEINEYSKDRLFIYLSDNQRDIDRISKLKAAKHPVIHLPISHSHDLAALFYIWEIAVSVMCSILGINAFDQPNVQLSKRITQEMIVKFLAQENIVREPPLYNAGWCEIYGNERLGGNIKVDIGHIIQSFLGAVKEGDYFTINAFLPMTKKNDEIFLEIRKNITSKNLIPTTLGYGPRFLHSTGQLHKGGKNNGHFIIITEEKTNDMEIPGQQMTFADLQFAQAIGDMRALEEMNRHVMWLHLKPGTLEKLITLF